MACCLSLISTLIADLELEVESNKFEVIRVSTVATRRVTVPHRDESHGAPPCGDEIHGARIAVRKDHGAASSLQCLQSWSTIDFFFVAAIVLSLGGWRRLYLPVHVDRFTSTFGCVKNFETRDRLQWRPCTIWIAGTMRTGTSLTRRCATSSCSRSSCRSCSSAGRTYAQISTSTRSVTPVVPA